MVMGSSPDEYARASLLPRSGLLENALALQVDDLFRLGDRKGDGILAARIGIGTDEAMLLHAFGRILLDDAASLVLPVVAERRRADAIAVVFDRRRGRLV